MQASAFQINEKILVMLQEMYNGNIINEKLDNFLDIPTKAQILKLKTEILFLGIANRRIQWSLLKNLYEYEKLRIRPTSALKYVSFESASKGEFLPENIKSMPLNYLEKLKKKGGMASDSEEITDSENISLYEGFTSDEEILVLPKGASSLEAQGLSSLKKLIITARHSKLARLFKKCLKTLEITEME